MATEKPSRIVPIYLLIDTSGSMDGEPIQQVMNGMDVIKEELMKDPRWASFWLSVITFHTTAQQEIPLTPLKDFIPPRLKAEGNTALGGALKVLMDCIQKEVRPREPEPANVAGDWRPVVYLLTDGEPNDSHWQDAIAEFEKFRPRPASVIACGAGPQANKSVLKQIAETVIMINAISSKDWVEHFVVASQSILAGASKAQKQPPVTTEDFGDKL